MVVGRLFNVVSPGRGSALRALVKQAVSGEAITVHGDGRQATGFSLSQGLNNRLH